jgi:hypothetical protein
VTAQDAQGFMATEIAQATLAAIRFISFHVKSGFAPF